jgi:hypothetical protein
VSDTKNIDEAAAKLEAAERRAMNHGFNHGEAFCLMLYRDTHSRREEWLWNSRDGVTPFVIRSASGQREMRHDEWFRDTRAPWFIPPIGSRIFVDLTEERAREHAATIHDRFATDAEHGADFLARNPDRDAYIIGQARYLMEYGGGGSPDIVVVTPELQATFRARHPPAVKPVSTKRFG